MAGASTEPSCMHTLHTAASIPLDVDSQKCSCSVFAYADQIGETALVCAGTLQTMKTTRENNKNRIEFLLNFNLFTSASNCNGRLHSNIDIGQHHNAPLRDVC